MNDIVEPDRRRDAAQISRLLCRLQEGVGDGCQCNGEPTKCRAIPMYARHAAAILSYLEKASGLTYGGTP